jgi:hypothetical protein
MAEISLILLKVFLFAWVFTRFKPLQWLLELLPQSLVFNLVRLLLSCGMCVSFWTSLALMQNIWLACGSAFIFFWYDKLIGWRENVVRLK